MSTATYRSGLDALCGAIADMEYESALQELNEVFAEAGYAHGPDGNERNMLRNALKTAAGRQVFNGLEDFDVGYKVSRVWKWSAPTRAKKFAEAWGSADGRDGDGAAGSHDGDGGGGRGDDDGDWSGSARLRPVSELERMLYKGIPDNVQRKLLTRCMAATCLSTQVLRKEAPPEEALPEDAAPASFERPEACGRVEDRNGQPLAGWRTDAEAVQLVKEIKAEGAAGAGGTYRMPDFMRDFARRRSIADLTDVGWGMALEATVLPALRDGFLAEQRSESQVNLLFGCLRNLLDCTVVAKPGVAFDVAGGAAVRVPDGHPLEYGVDAADVVTAGNGKALGYRRAVSGGVVTRVFPHGQDGQRRLQVSCNVMLMCMIAACVYGPASRLALLASVQGTMGERPAAARVGSGLGQAACAGRMGTRDAVDATCAEPGKIALCVVYDRAGGITGNRAVFDGGQVDRIYVGRETNPKDYRAKAAQLKVLKQAGAGARGRLEERVFHVPERPLHELVSGCHAMLDYRAGAWHVYDLGSKHGTAVLRRDGTVQALVREWSDERKSVVSAGVALEPGDSLLLGAVPGADEFLQGAFIAVTAPASADKLRDVLSRRAAGW